MSNNSNQSPKQFTYQSSNNSKSTTIVLLTLLLLLELGVAILIFLGWFGSAFLYPYASPSEPLILSTQIDLDALTFTFIGYNLALWLQLILSISFIVIKVGNRKFDTKSLYFFFLSALLLTLISHQLSELFVLTESLVECDQFTGVEPGCYHDYVP